MSAKRCPSFRYNSGASSNELDIRLPRLATAGSGHPTRRGSSVLFSLAMGFGHRVERDAVDDARMVFLVALLLKRARSAGLRRKRALRFSTPSGLAGRGARPRAAVTRSTSAMVLVAIVASGMLPGGAGARSRPPHEALVPTSLVATSSSLAPFQHVRFCIRYPADCRSNPTEAERIDLTDENSALLDRVNRSANATIAPVQKSYGRNLGEAWTIAPLAGDCNDYAVTKRHELLRSGLPAKALRLAVVKTTSGSGHLVLLAATTKGDLVLDNLTEEIVPWQSTDYRWMKIQSVGDARVWYQVDRPGAAGSSRERESPVTARRPDLKTPRTGFVLLPSVNAGASRAP
jgi:predicted transglutaminase-like cysteine proteinase